MHPVRRSYVDNLLGDLDATLAVATSATGGVYPPGSVVQAALVPPAPPEPEASPAR
jgi:hypothetical protein